ncbi:Dual specificity tyrosine-phosphorylation-regulated kinase 3 [Beauveria bassiana]|nr:Dual specificity tyrosine-phosphorylation-regulated kinase 3 [Beauveria bassiana]
MAPFQQLEMSEQAQASTRKVLGDRTIYLSRQTPKTDGDSVLADLGSARFGQEQYEGDVMPLVYRAPEVILGMRWSSKVDIWSVGVMVWDLLEGKRLFLNKKDGVNDDEQHLTEMVALIGPPPLEFLRRSKWLGSVAVPTTSLEERVTQLEGQDKALLLGFVRRALRWLPEERPPADEIVYDGWLMQRYSELDA